MDKQTKNKIKSMVLVLREDFEKEVENRLNNMGISPDREWKDGRSLPHLSEDEIGRNELEKRRRIAAFINREIKAGQSQKAATEEFIREASYTWINRLIGLKCLESQDLIEEVITTRPEYGNRSKQHRDFREKNPKAASRPDDGLIGCLFSAFEAITEEIRVLFDPKDEYSLIIPRYPVLKNAIEKINTQLDYETYQADDFLGWVYQYFNSKEKDKVFEEVRTKKKKIAGNDIINATQLYTEKYMVHFLVENSLGAMWMEMYPDSPLSSRWEYFVEDPNNTTRETKPIKEIKFLDPACGSGHFLLYAFDLFYTMYEEEGVIPRDQIPEFILKNNLYGIDIDQRAIQLSALALYMKAKSKNPDMKVQHMNLVSANAVMLNSDILEEFLQDFEGDEVAQELITTIWHGLVYMRELGSLLKIEEQIDGVIKQQKKKGTKLDFYIEGNTKSWEQWKNDLLNALKIYYKRVSEGFDINKKLFASEAYKGVQFLDFLEQKYDIVTTNPPYMGKKNMSNKYRTYLISNYKNFDADMYISFIDRCSTLTDENGFCSMITQQSFMFVSSFEAVRELIFKKFAIRTIAQLGKNSFNEIGGSNVNTAMFVIKRDVSNSKDFVGTYFKLTDYPTTEDKEESLKNFKNNCNNLKYEVLQKDFSLIPLKPMVFWVSHKIRILFNNEPLSKFALPQIGMATGNNDMFIRFYWEIERKEDFVPYIKGFGYRKYFGTSPIVLWYSESAKRLLNRTSGARLNRGYKYYFREGITYNAVSEKGFTCRYLPEGFMFDAGGPCIFLKNNIFSNFYFIGLLNSKLIDYLLYILNPSINMKSIDIQRLPIKIPSININEKISMLAEKCISTYKCLDQYSINDPVFSQTTIEWGYTKMNEK